MSQYLALVRLYYQVDGKKTCAPANTVAFDFPEDQIESALAKGYIRKATVGEIAEAEATASAAPKKAGAAKPKRAAKAEKAEPEKKPEPEKKADDGASAKGDDKADLA
jgi:hypothetical protein